MPAKAGKINANQPTVAVLQKSWTWSTQPARKERSIVPFVPDTFSGF